MNGREKEILAVLRREVVPAIGCTEPVAVALAAARAAEELGQPVESLDVAVSGNLVKNGMGVMVPGTGEAGLPIAAAAGALGGKSALALECLSGLDAEQARQAREMVRAGKINMGLPDNDILLYCKVTAKGGGHEAAAEIRDAHANITRVWKDGRLVYEKQESAGETRREEAPLSLALIYGFATTVPAEDITFIMDAAAMNRAVAEEGLRRDYGLALGKNLDERIKRGILPDDMANFAVKMTVAATDARMAGVQMPVMSNSGSGNQGLACTMPVVACAMRLGKTETEMARALIISHLVSIHIKRQLGKLSALCGVLVAAMAAACGIVHLLGGGLEQMEMTIRNMVGNLSGMICDGAKSSCALKVNTAVNAGIQAAMLAMEGIAVPGNEGIVSGDVESCIASLGRLGSSGMRETDKVILDIMLHKS